MTLDEFVFLLTHTQSIPRNSKTRIKVFVPKDLVVVLVPEEDADDDF